MLMSALLLLKSLPEVLPWTGLLAAAPTCLLVTLPLRACWLILPSRTYGYLDDYLWGSYQKLVLFFFEKLSPVEILFYGDVEAFIRSKESVLYISNHQSTVDWMVADMLAVRQGCLGNIRYVLKDGLRFLPLYGLHFYQHDCVYVRRGRNFSSEVTRKNLAAIPKRRATTWMVIFPEGTRFKPDNLEAIASSQNYARENNLTLLRSHLVPRTKAFYLSLSSLRSYLDAVYDVTVIYSQSRVVENGVSRRVLAPSMNDYMHGKGEQLHIIINRVPVSEVPADEQGMQQWLYAAFEGKDRLLDHYFISGEVQGAPYQLPLPWRQVLPATVFYAGATALLWSHPTGRKVYLGAAVLGTLLGAAVMAVRRVA